MEFVETFHPVGQGLFYSGCIGGSFNFVYDCGSTSQAKKLKQAIVRYKKDVTKIHLLIISHFDKDHISGLDDLLANLELDSVVMPYVNILERILCILSSNLRSRWYRDFLVDPVEYLRSKGAKRIVFILPGDVGGADPSDTPDTGTNT
ncbi:MAG: MBL fold metallo-hydrolase, partial [Alicyclobacillus sp.]|nr:MBL fold metallo-hydrolase [Alicyclobacillus sp.]